MKLREILRFEFAYQIRSLSTWLYFVVLGVVAYLMIINNYLSDARNGDFLLNSPFVIAAVSVLCSVLWLLIAASIAGNAAARDVQIRMHSILYAVPVSKAEFLGGRFLAAFLINSWILLAVPVGILLAIYASGVEPEVLGQFRLATYLSTYGFITLPSAFAATALQFSLAAVSGRIKTAYFGSLLLFVTTYIVAGAVAVPLGMRELGKLLDPIGVITILGEISKAWTPLEKNTHLIGLEGPLLANRILWLGIALSVLTFTHRRFRFAEHTATTWWNRIKKRKAKSHLPDTCALIDRSEPVIMPQVRQTFGFATTARQTLTIAWTSFRMMVRSRGGLIPIIAITAIAGLYTLGHMKFMSVPLIPRTDHILTFLTAPLMDFGTAWVIIPLLTIFYAGEVIWREREARLSEIIDAAPVPDWVLFLGKFLGLSLVLVVWMALLVMAGVLVQVAMHYNNLEIVRYLQILFGLQLADYLLFAVLAFTTLALVNQKHIGYLVALIAYGCIVFASKLGIEHNLLIYGSDPGWGYSDMRGFGASVGPWLWFKLYWASWAILLAVVARIFWVRGRESGLGARLQLARRRITRATVGISVIAAGLILAFGGYVFYNTNVLNGYETVTDRINQSTEYERRYGHYRDIPQPQLSRTNLRVEIYPELHVVDIAGTYLLVNNNAVDIDSVHLDLKVAPDEVEFNRQAVPVLQDDELGYRIYTMEEPIQPGDSLQVGFKMRIESRGFRNSGIDPSVVESSAYFTNLGWLPSIGYQPNRELTRAGDRRAKGLAPRTIPSPYDIEASHDGSTAERTTFEAVVGTETGYVAVAPGALHRTWTEGGRRYFHYVTDVPIRNEYAFFSADYALHEGQWDGVAIQIFHHPKHTGNLNRMVQSIQASLSHYTEQFGPYPYSHIRLIERPGHGYGMHSDAINIAFDEGFSRLNPNDEQNNLDLPFYVVAHEVAHQWWGTQLTPAYAEGGILLIESLASYSAYQVVEKVLGPEQMRLLFKQLRVAYETPRARAAVPLLRATDPFLAYRKGPFALYALSKYIGAQRVNDALRHLLEEHGSDAPSLPTSLDLYRELQVVTPDSLQYLLYDLFEANTYWEFETERATAEQTEAGNWQVTLGVRARKVVVDTAGIETEVPMSDWVEIGVFGSSQACRDLGQPIYLQKRRIQSGEQTISVTLQDKPASAGIDPNHLLIDLDVDDNTKEVTLQK